MNTIPCNPQSNLPNWPFILLGAVLGATLGYIGSFFLYRWRDVKTAKKEFRRAFVGILSEFGQKKADRMSVGTAIDQHETAITEFRFYLNGRKRTAFEHDCEQYRQCRNRCLASGTDLIADSLRRAREKIDEPKLNALDALKQSIEKLMDYTR